MTAQPADREPQSGVAATPRPRRPLTVSAGTVEAVFSWAGDRWRHVILIEGRPWAESVEGTPPSGDPAWPSSPPLVELSPTGTSRGPAILGVGLAGRSHFSASIAPHPDLPDTLVFELACRIKGAPAWLGSTYVLEGGRLFRVTASPVPAGLPATIRWTYAVNRGGFHLQAPATMLGGG